MKINYKNFVSFAMTLQILILLFGIAATPAAAIDNPISPSDQLYVKGTVSVDGEPAPLNTQIVAKVDGVLVGSAKVDQVGGKYGDKPSFPINCNSDKYGDIKFYVNNVEAKLSDLNILNDAIAGQIIESVNLIVTSPVVKKENEKTGGFGGSAPTNDIGSESLSESTPSASTTPFKSVAATQLTDDSVEYEEEVLESETGSPMMLLLIGAILFLGIIITVGYKLKEN